MENKIKENYAEFFTENFCGNKLSVKCVLNNTTPTSAMMLQPMSYSMSYYYNNKYTGINVILNYKKVNEVIERNCQSLSEYALECAFYKLDKKEDYFGNKKYILNK